MLRAAGVSERMIRTQTHAGRLLRLRQGVYLASAVWPSDSETQHQLLARAEAVANPQAVLSHQSAALVWGLPTPGFVAWHELPVSVTFRSEGGHGWKNGPTTAHRQAVLPPSQVVQDPAGYRVTSLARTAVDLCDGLELPQALVLLDAAARRLCAGYVGSPRRRDFVNPKLAAAARTELAAVADTLRRSRLLAAIAVCDPARESAAESLSAGHFRQAGLPTPRHQVPLETARGIFFPDCYWPQVRLVGECDGAVKYADAAGYVLEKEREQALRDAGFAIVRWLAKEIMTQPAAVVGRVARAIDANQ